MQPVNEKSSSAVSGIAIVNTVGKTILWTSLLVFVPFVLVPHAQELFEEVGIMLPAITEAIIGVTSYARKFWFIFFPIALIAPLTLEVNILLFAPRGAKFWLNLWSWISLLVISLIVALGIFLPMAQITAALS